MGGCPTRKWLQVPREGPPAFVEAAGQGQAWTLWQLRVRSPARPTVGVVRSKDWTEGHELLTFELLRSLGTPAPSKKEGFCKI